MAIDLCVYGIGAKVITATSRIRRQLITMSTLLRWLDNLTTSIVFMFAKERTKKNTSREVEWVCLPSQNEIYFWWTLYVIVLQIQFQIGNINNSLECVTNVMWYVESDWEAQADWLQQIPSTDECRRNCGKFIIMPAVACIVFQQSITISSLCAACHP